MKFLNDNHYALIFGSRCNLNCSYCSFGLYNEQFRKNTSSYIEDNLFKLINFLSTLEHGIITITGGEPSLFQNMPKLTQSLRNIRWIVFSNIEKMHWSSSGRKIE